MSLDGLIDRTAPLPPTATGAQAYARFRSEPAAQLLAVVDSYARPIGLLDRNTVLAAMASEAGHGAHGGGPALHLALTDIVVVEEDAAVEEVCREVLAAPAARAACGFAVTRNGRFEGVATVGSLLGAAHAASALRAEEALLAAERLRRAEAQAQAAARAQAQFVGVMSHEIRTPLTGVLAVAELLGRQPLSADGRTHVRTLISSSRGLIAVLSDAIDLAQAEVEGLRLSPQPTRLRDLMDELEAAWLPRAGDNGVGLSIAYHGEPGWAAELDRIRLRQVFDRLMANALRHTRQGSVEVGLEASPEGDRIRLLGRVRDTGPGVDASQTSTLFEPFARDRTGPGLGLAMCRTVLEAMGGRIWAENNRGRGAEFRFEVEAPACAAPGEDIEPAGEPDAGLRGHVLIVDDNATNRMVAQTLVEMLGCTVETAEDGVEAVEAVRRNSFDAILMDIRMPRMDGEEATRTIRGLAGPARSTPVIALTANADPEDVCRYLACGMASVVEKPIKAERLLTALAEVLTTLDHARTAAAA